MHSDDEDLSTSLHSDIDKKGARPWEDLLDHEKEIWKKRLVDAGEWSVSEGESVLKGVLFSQVAGAVGGAVRGA